MAHVLIIEDDSMIAAIERDFLEANGFEVSVAMTGKEGMKIFDSGTIEAVLLDIGLPDTDGFMLCRKLRDISNVPILFITARGSDDDKIKGLGLGADDYIVKPFNPSEMMARLKAHLEIHQRLLGVRLQDADDNKPDIRVGDLRIFIKRHQVFRGKTEINLTGKEFNLLFFPDSIQRLRRIIARFVGNFFRHFVAVDSGIGQFQQQIKQHGITAFTLLQTRAQQCQNRRDIFQTFHGFALRQLSQVLQIQRQMVRQFAAV